MRIDLCTAHRDCYGCSKKNHNSAAAAAATLNLLLSLCFNTIQFMSVCTLLLGYLSYLLILTMYFSYMQLLPGEKSTKSERNL